MQFIARKIDGELYVSIDQVNKAIEEKDAEIENLKAKIRRLQRALYKAWLGFNRRKKNEETTETIQDVLQVATSERVAKKGN